MAAFQDVASQPPRRWLSFIVSVERQTAVAARQNPQVRQTRPNELVVCAPADTALDCVAEAIDKLGTVKQRDSGQHVIEGRIRYGLQSVKVRVSLVERIQGETTVVIQASSDDVWGAGAKNATSRLAEMLLNLDNPGYRPDRLGMHPAALVGILIGFVMVLVLVMKYVWPAVLR